MNKKLKLIVGGVVLALVLVFSFVSCQLQVEPTYAVRTGTVDYYNYGIPTITTGYYRYGTLTSSQYSYLYSATSLQYMTEGQIRSWLSDHYCQNYNLNEITNGLMNTTNYAYIDHYTSSWCYVIMKN